MSKTNNVFQPSSTLLETNISRTRFVLASISIINGLINQPIADMHSLKANTLQHCRVVNGSEKGTPQVLSRDRNPCWNDVAVEAELLYSSARNMSKSPYAELKLQNHSISPWFLQSFVPNQINPSSRSPTFKTISTQTNPNWNKDSHERQQSWLAEKHHKSSATTRARMRISLSSLRMLRLWTTGRQTRVFRWHKLLARSRSLLPTSKCDVLYPSPVYPQLLGALYRWSCISISAFLPNKLDAFAVRGSMLLIGTKMLMDYQLGTGPKAHSTTLQRQLLRTNSELPTTMKSSSRS